MKKALILWGGWDGHTPQQTTRLFARELEKKGFNVRLVHSLKPLENLLALKKFDLIVPFYTMSEISDLQLANLLAAVRGGAGIAGVHGGMCDAFRGRVLYAWMTGGQFVEHPHIGDFTVRITNVRSPITRGMKRRFAYNSEQYYMVVDPGNTVLADTIYTYEGRKCVMPVVWTKAWGKGRVFFSALGHVVGEFEKYPEVLAMTMRGMLWAARKPRTSRARRKS
jgi:hypothetical protein